MKTQANFLTFFIRMIRWLAAVSRGLQNSIWPRQSRRHRSGGKLTCVTPSGSGWSGLLSWKLSYLIICWSKLEEQQESSRSLGLLDTQTAPKWSRVLGFALLTLTFTFPASLVQGNPRLHLPCSTTSKEVNFELALSSDRQMSFVNCISCFFGELSKNWKYKYGLAQKI